MVSIEQTGMIPRIKLFLALSRTPHAILDVTTPAMAALLWLNGFPPLKVIVIGLITAFAGYTAVYALNDLVDLRVDREKFRSFGVPDSGQDLDAVFIRHPMAQGFLGLREAIIWTLGWALLALVGAYLLNPVCALIFLMVCVFEAVYCLLLRVSHLRAALNGFVKTSGALAAVFAVDSDLDPLLLFLFFLWIFFWEIGGQNVPNDWADVEEDRRIHAKTLAVRYGPRVATIIILGSLGITTVLGTVLFCLAPGVFEPFTPALALLAGIAILVFPAYRLYRVQNPKLAIALFNRASYYPVAMLVVVLIRILI